MSKFLKILSILSLTIGTTLILINLIGLIIPLKNQAIYTQSSGFSDDITLSTNEALNIINRPIINREQYVRDVTYAINKSVLHYWTGIHEKKYNVILPFYENYLLSTFIQIFHANPPRYEFCNYKKTIQRGVGWCSQVSIALADLLNNQKINTNVIAWPEHTVTEVEISTGKWWVVDPDYGVLIEHSMQDIDSDPSIVLPFYEKMGYSNNITTAYIAPGKKVYSYYQSGFSECNMKKKFIEDASYILIWLIPLILITLPSFIFFKKRHVK